MSEPGSARVLLVIATLGQRPEYLEQTIASIRDQLIPVDLVLVAPIGNQHVQDLAATMAIPLLPDPGSLPEAINAGATALKPQHDYINWLNDDDLLEPNTIHRVVAALDNNPKASVAFGHCRYIDTQGQELWISRTGKLAPWVLPWGPDLVPQPGMLVRASAWNQVGGIDSSFSLAFDLDLLLKLRKVGSLIAVPEVVSSFRWHPDSLTVDDRTKNLVESERAKRAALPAAIRPLTPLWDYPMRVAIRFAAKRVTSRAQKLSSA
jgi:GT2 family glycosyltransferase